MNRQLVQLQPGELDCIATIGDDGELVIDTEAVASCLSRAMRLVGIRVGVAGADCLRHGDGTPEPATRNLTGIWWLYHGDDTALVGGFVVDGLAMTITTEGEGEAPLAEGVEIIGLATRAIASQYDGAEMVDVGLVKVPSPSGEKPVRVAVTRDHRIRRPQDILSAGELRNFESGQLGLVIVQLIGAEKALVIQLGI
ncbi:MAG: hypothetical protein FD171_53 [Actinobacteria bacterium]|nr:MAG: hypothetical protein FD171_53 [Actinomycetota bacterium]